EAGPVEQAAVLTNGELAHASHDQELDLGELRQVHERLDVLFARPHRRTSSRREEECRTDGPVGLVGMASHNARARPIGPSLPTPWAHRSHTPSWRLMTITESPPSPRYPRSPNRSSARGWRRAGRARCGDSAHMARDPECPRDTRPCAAGPAAPTP